MKEKKRERKREKEERKKKGDTERFHQYADCACFLRLWESHLFRQVCLKTCLKEISNKSRGGGTHWVSNPAPR